ncbi:hypothetical protein GCM10007170_40430 [Arthrobacter liuii]|uniref:Uncharacterized protein n=1 Tax=Arthrobacter liuii TaxID=1476996 RepID=A0ABQ2AZN0_9MICC|nr:hypothetical protein GCM10007170_40430 [Arthrobacter liuii]
MLLGYKAFTFLCLYGSRLETLPIDEPIVNFPHPYEEVPAVKSRKSIVSFVEGRTYPFLDRAEIRPVAGLAAGDRKSSVGKAAPIQLVHRSVPEVELPQQPLRKDVFNGSLIGSLRNVNSAKEA